MAKRVYWFLCGNENNPSSRIHGLNVHKKLKSRGVSSSILFKPGKYSTDIFYNRWMLILVSKFMAKDSYVLFQKLSGPRSEWFAKVLKERGISVGYIDCDLPLKENMARLSDCIICPSAELCSYYEKAGFQNVIKIEDAVEQYLPPINSHQSKKRIVWFGKSGKGKWEMVEWFKREILPSVSDKWDFITVSDHQNSTYQWHVDTISNIVNQCDLVVIPSKNEEADLVKSANRCTQSFALGLPVLTVKIPSYQEVIQNFYNGYISDDRNEWINFIRKLEDDSYLWQLKQNAYSSSKQFSIEEIIKEWMALLKLPGDTRFNFSVILLRLLVIFFNALQPIKRLVVRSI